MEQDESLSASPKPMRKAISIKLKSNKSPSTSRRKTRSTRSSKKEENEPVQAAGNEIRDFPTILKLGPGGLLNQGLSIQICIERPWLNLG